MSQTSALRRPIHASDRFTGVVALLATAGTHIPLVSEHLHEAPYVGWLFIVLCVAAVALAAALLVADTPVVWALAGLTCVAALAAFLLSRTVGLPQIGDDVGNWTEALSYPAVAAELIVVVTAAGVLWREERAAPRPA